MELEILSTTEEDIKNSLKLRLSNSKKIFEKVKKEIIQKEEKFVQEKLLFGNSDNDSSDDEKV
jgi:hypothetical protein